MHLKQYFQTSIQQLGYVQDTEQNQAVDAFSELQARLIQRQRSAPAFFDRMRFLPRRGNQAQKRGLYVWGGVGRGKTWIMDLFYNSTPLEKKTRLHFHQFMRRIHTDLTGLKAQRDPLKQIARQWAEKYRLICLDEFHVTDITDAMLLYGLLDALFANGLVIVTTSNLKPDDLYKNGLQRDRFIPAIELIKTHTRVVNLGGEYDYRLRGEQHSKVYYTPLSEETTQLLAAHYDAICTHEASSENAPMEVVPDPQSVCINHRDIEIIAKSESIIWFDFHALCCTARSAIDYMEIAQQFHSVVISNVLQMNDAHDDWARRFINLIDVFYDHKTRLILSAETEPGQLYQGQRLRFEFDRTLSRINEMQSRDYQERCRAAQANAA